MIISQISPNMNNYKTILKEANQRVSFTAAPILPKTPQKSKFFKYFTDRYDKAIDKTAIRLGKLINNKDVHNIFERTKNSKYLFSNLMTFGSFVLSSLYVIRTLTNKSLDEKKRKTLAINQAAVFGVSTAMCYTVDGILNKKITQFANRFEAVNFNRIEAEKLSKCVKGVGIAGKIIIFDTIYRFIAPVFVTPIANKLGDRVNEKKQLNQK